MEVRSIAKQVFLTPFTPGNQKRAGDSPPTRLIVIGLFARFKPAPISDGWQVRFWFFRTPPSTTRSPRGSATAQDVRVNGEYHVISADFTFTLFCSGIQRHGADHFTLPFNDGSAGTGEEIINQCLLALLSRAR
jgi:hypothetical protein